MIDLKVSREHIDAIDKQIVELFEKRMIESSEVAKYKLETGKPVYDKEREEDKLKNLKSMSSNEFNQRAITELFSQIMSISRKYQYGVLPMTTKLSDFVKADKLPVDEQTKVCYFGVPGTHTQQAMENFFGEEINGISCPTFQSVMEAVEKGEAQYGVLPIENSSTGGITANYDLLLNYTNSIVGQYVNKIDQCLVALPGTRIEDIKTVYSHPQALMQCSQYLTSHRQWRQVSMENTAVSAKKVLEDADVTQAAVASEIAGKLYGLKVLQPSINYNKNNVTRFIILAKAPVYCKGANKISICFECAHKSGTLYNMLGNLIYNGVNMLMIESRPIPGRSWEYRFFVDVEGTLSDPAVQNALKGISEEAATLRVLGNYEAQTDK